MKKPALAIRNGIKATLRTPGKALLYCCILILLGVLTSAAFCVNTAVRGYLADCDAFYHTVVNAEYIGDAYPEINVIDPAFTEALRVRREGIEALTADPSVLSWEPAADTAAYVTGLHRKDRDVYDADEAVLAVYLLGYDERMMAWQGTIADVRYSGPDASRKMVLVCTDREENDAGDRLEKGRYYLMCGRFFRGSSSYLWFEARETQFGPKEAPTRVPSFMPAASPEEPNALYDSLAALMAQRNDACHVQFTSALEDQITFHQQKQAITEGRSFTAEEYGTGAKVCVLPESMTSLLECGVGDEVSLSFSEAGGDLYAGLLSVSDAEPYRIVGICSRDESNLFRIYLPRAAGAAPVPSSVIGYRLGQLRVRNAQIDAFLEKAAPLEEHGFRFTVYDQGYGAAVEPMLEILLISRIFLAVCLLLAAAVLCLQSYMFILRQRESAGIMLALGSGKGHVLAYFLTCAAAVSLPGILIGCAAGSLLDRTVYRVLSDYAAKAAAPDLRYSVSALSVTRHLDFASGGSLLVYAAAAGLLLAAAAAFTLLFACLCLRTTEKKKKKKRKTRTVRRELRASSHLTTRLKYAILSMRRSPARTLAALLLAAVVTVFFGQLTASMDAYHERLAQIRESAVIRGHATDPSGQQVEKLLVSAPAVEKFVSSGLLAGFCVSNDVCHLRFHGIAATAQGETRELPEPVYPVGSFAVETFFRQMTFEPSWVRTSSVTGNGRFYYTDPPLVEWLDGYSDDFSGGKVCVIPKSLQEEHGIALGDTVRFVFAITYYGSPFIDTTDLKVVGTYRGGDSGRTVFSPMDLTELELINSHFLGIYALSRGYSSFTFTLKSAAQLDEVRDALTESGFTWIGSGARPPYYALLDDGIYLSAVRSMERQIRYVGVMHGALYVLAALLSFAVAWLMVSSRRPEIALMRALGTQRGRIVGNFVFEQVFLCALGIGAGFLLWRMLGHVPGPAHLALSGAYLGIWGLSSLLCALTGVRSQAYAQLTEPE